MAYYFKGARILAPYTISSNEPVYEVDTVSLGIQRASQGAQRWELNFTTITTSNEEADLMVGTVLSINSTETMIMPQLPSVAKKNTASANLAVTSSALAGATSLQVSNDGLLSKGSFVKLSNHDKLYMVTADVEAGTVDVPIYPILRKTISTATVLLTGSAAVITCYRDISNVRGITFQDGILSNAGSITLIEAV
jgi:hypothetical protein